MNSKNFNRNIWALSLCLGVIFTHSTGYAAEEERAIGGAVEDMGRPMPMPKPTPCPNPVNLTINVGAPNQADFSAAQWNAPRAGLNDHGKNKHFLGTFQWKPKYKCCEIASATLTVTMQANSGGQSANSPDAGNDGIGVVNAGITVPPYSGAVYTGLWPFSAGKQVTKTWNITGAALAKIESGGGLSFAVQDDTMVKSATLVLRGCCLNK